MSDSNLFFVFRDLVLIAVASFVGGLVGVTYGISSERTRIYQSCLETNSAIIYQEAKQKCDQLVSRK